ncbi:MAG TPA: ABC transporter permease [Alphaproteobacteria bacterium]|nr:ABC transporter permease [Alphaproteobacteria bacterium]
MSSTTQQPNNLATHNADNVRIIESTSSWFHVPWRELLHYRDLLFLLVRRDFVSRYKQTILGPAWFIIQPLLHTIIFTVVMGQIAGLSEEKMPKILFYYSGMLAWQYFGDCLKGTSTTFLSNAQLFGKVYFPRLIMPMSVIISNLFAYVLHMATFIAFFIYYKWFSWAGDNIQPNWSIMFLPLIILQTAALGLGVGLWMSALTAKYRDFHHLSGFMIECWKYATVPLLMSLSKVPENMQWLLAVNPVSPLVLWYRHAFLGLEAPSSIHMAVSAIVTLLILFSGIIIFTRTEKTFIDMV